MKTKRSAKKTSMHPTQATYALARATFERQRCARRIVPARRLTHLSNTHPHQEDSMDIISASVTHEGHNYTATANAAPGGRVVIACDKQWVGTGRWNGKAIEDCPAVLPDGVYDALDAALSA